MDKRSSLTKWLRTKGYHINDIAVALHWYDAECAMGMIPCDSLVCEIAEICHGKAIEQSIKQIPPLKVSIRYKLHAKMIIASILSGIGGSSILFLIIYRSEIYQWLLAQMQSLLSLMG